MKDSLLRREWKFLLFGFLLSFFSAPGQTFFIGLFNADIRAELQLSHGELGTYYSIATLCSAILIIWTGPLIDRLDLRRFTLTVIAGAAAGCLLLAFSHNIILLVFAFFVSRHFSAGLMTMASSTSMVRYLSRDKAKANAIASMGYRTAESVLPALILIYLAHYSWRSGLIAIAALLLVGLAPLIMYLLKNHAQRHLKLASSEVADGSPQYQASWTRRQVLGDYRFYLSMPALMSSAFIFTGVIFHQAFMLEEKQWSREFWGLAFAIHGLSSMLSALLTGNIADKYGAVRCVPLAAIPLCLAMLLLAVSSGEWMGVVIMCLMGLSVGATATLGSPFFSEMYGNEHLGSIKSLSSSVLVFSTALSPVLVGQLLDRGVAFTEIALGGAVYALIACICAAFSFWLSQRQAS